MRGGSASAGGRGRDAIAAIWGGIEAILGVDQELSFRISHYLSHILSDDPRTRSQRKAEIRKLYSQRSKAVHGVGMKEADLERVRSESWELLSQALQQLIERERVFTAAELDDMLSGLPPK